MVLPLPLWWWFSPKTGGSVQILANFGCKAASATPTNADIETVLPKPGEPLLISFEFFDVFSAPSGQKLSSDRKSVAYRFLYRAPDRTLKAEEVDTAHQKVLEALTQKLGVKFR